MKLKTLSGKIISKARQENYECIKQGSDEFVSTSAYFENSSAWVINCLYLNLPYISAQTQHTHFICQIVIIITCITVGFIGRQTRQLFPLQLVVLFLKIQLTISLLCYLTISLLCHLKISLLCHLTTSILSYLTTSLLCCFITL